MIAAILAQNDIPLTLENLIEYIFAKTALYSGNYKHFHRSDYQSGNIILNFEHSFGKKRSRLLGTAFTKIINSLWSLPTELTITDRTIKIIIDVGSYHAGSG